MYSLPPQDREKTNGGAMTDAGEVARTRWDVDPCPVEPPGEGQRVIRGGTGRIRCPQLFDPTWAGRAALALDRLWHLLWITGLLSVTRLKCIADRSDRRRRGADAMRDHPGRDPRVGTKCLHDPATLFGGSRRPGAAIPTDAPLQRDNRRALAHGDPQRLNRTGRQSAQPADHAVRPFPPSAQ